MMTEKAHQREWQALQTQFDSYEKWSLLIKLTHLITAALLIATQLISLPILAIGFGFWLQDGIWKTFQARIEHRLLQLEAHLAKKSQTVAFQFNREFSHRRGGTKQLLREYVGQSLKPTVAFPHALLLALYVLVLFVF